MEPKGPSYQKLTALFRRRSILLQLVLFVLVLALWRVPIINPIKLIVVIFHELSHVAAAYLTGGVVFGIAIDPGGAGVTLGMGGSETIIVAAGYVGSLLVGILIYALVAVWEPDDIWGVFCILATLSVAFGWLNDFTAIFGYGTMALLFLCYFKLSAEVKKFVLRWIATTSCLYPVLDVAGEYFQAEPQGFVVGGQVIGSDVARLAELTGIPVGTLTAVWATIGLGTLCFLVIWSSKKDAATTIKKKLSLKKKLVPILHPKYNPDDTSNLPTYVIESANPRVHPSQIDWKTRPPSLLPSCPEAAEVEDQVIHFLAVFVQTLQPFHQVTRVDVAIQRVGADIVIARRVGRRGLRSRGIRWRWPHHACWRRGRGFHNLDRGVVEDRLAASIVTVLCIHRSDIAGVRHKRPILFGFHVRLPDSIGTVRLVANHHIGQTAGFRVGVTLVSVQEIVFRVITIIRGEGKLRRLRGGRWGSAVDENPPEWWIRIHLGSYGDDFARTAAFSVRTDGDESIFIKLIVFHQGVYVLVCISNDVDALVINLELAVFSNTSGHFIGIADFRYGRASQQYGEIVPNKDTTNPWDGGESWRLELIIKRLVRVALILALGTIVFTPTIRIWIKRISSFHTLGDINQSVVIRV